jgi:hypothetical protein
MANSSTKSQKAKTPPAAATPKPEQTQAQREALKQQIDAAHQSTRVQVQARREAQRAAVERARRIRQIVIGTVVAVLVIGGGAGVYGWTQYTHPGEFVPEMSDRHHLEKITDPHVAYSTDPPTSGPHIGDLKPWGVYTETVANELLVHNLEDAGVVVNYRPDLPEADVAHLKALVESYADKALTIHNPASSNSQSAGGGYVIMVPYKGLSDPIVLTAWTRMQRFQAYDEAAMRHFIDMYRGIDHHEISTTK